MVGNLCKARAFFADIEPGGADPKVSGIFLSGDAGGVIVQGGDVVANPQDGSGPW